MYLFLLAFVAMLEGPVIADSYTPSPFLPPLLEFENGTAVETGAAWTERRGELKYLLQTYILGSFPQFPPPLKEAVTLNCTHAGPGVTSTFVRLTFDTSAGGGGIETVSFSVELLDPTSPGPLPVFLTQWNHRQWAVYGVGRGYRGVVYPGADVCDVAPEFQRAYPNASFALIAARAFVAMRTLDYVMTLPRMNVQEVAVSGHSRNGKQSLIFAAFDERVSAAVGSSPGAPVASPYRFTSSNFYGEGPRTGGVTCKGSKWWLCSSLEFDGHPERMPIDGHAIVGLCAPRHCAIATGHQDFASDMVFADEMNIAEAARPYRLLGADDALRNIYRYGPHHGFDDITTYFDWFDRAFNKTTAYQRALARSGVRTADSGLAFLQTWLTPAGFDWATWNASIDPNTRGAPPDNSAPIADRVRWLLALGGPDDARLEVFGAATTYCEETEAHGGFREAMMSHSTLQDGVSRQSVGIAGYLSASVYWPSKTHVDPSQALPIVIWLHPYSYNTGFAPAYSQARVFEDVAHKGYIVVAFDAVGFGMRNTQGGARFYARHGDSASLLGKMVADVRSAVDYASCLAPGARDNQTLCGQHGYNPPDTAGTSKVPYARADAIILAGFALGGTVALHAGVLDTRVTGVASFAGFTPMRTDTADRPTGGLRRLFDLHALVPRLGLYVGREGDVPYDYDELISELAPRHTLLYTPQSDRDATYSDVKTCANASRAAWERLGEGDKFTHLAPQTDSRMEREQVAALIAWLGNATAVA